MVRIEMIEEYEYVSNLLTLRYQALKREHTKKENCIKKALSSEINSEIEKKKDKRALEKEIQSIEIEQRKLERASHFLTLCNHFVCDIHNDLEL